MGVGRSTNRLLTHEFALYRIYNVLKHEFGVLMHAVGIRRTYSEWRIDGFSALLENKHRKLYHSPHLVHNGYTWKMTLSLHEKGFIGLFLNIVDVSSLPADTAVEVAFELGAVDQLRQEHVIETADRLYFCNTRDTWGCPEMVSLDKLKCPSSGFLVNDTCCFRANILSVRRRHMDWEGFERLPTQMALSPFSYRWKIEKFSELQMPYALSNVFAAGDQHWNLRLYPDGYEKNRCLAIYLDLLTASALPTNSKLYVDYSLCVVDQINGKHMKLSAKSHFDSKGDSRGWENFLSHEDLNDPSKGLLVENTCVIEASITVLQLVVDQ